MRFSQTEERAGVPKKSEFIRQAEIFKALGHPSRMAIIHALADGEVCACDLAAVVGSSLPTVSRHLSVLKHAGLIANERRGQQIMYRLVYTCVMNLVNCIGEAEGNRASETCCA